MKIHLIKLVFFSTLIPFLSFGQRKYDLKTIERYQLNYSPPKEKFKFSKIKDKSFPSLLDSNAVYISKSYDSEFKDSLISFIRFFNGNICFSSHPYYSTPDEIEFNQTDYGSWCMYKVNENKITLEYFETLNIPKRFFFSFGVINSDSIFWHKKRLGRFPLFSSDKLDAMDVKKKIEFASFKITWD